jgi:hypothetical protein
MLMARRRYSGSVLAGSMGMRNGALFLLVFSLDFGFVWVMFSWR